MAFRLHACAPARATVVLPALVTPPSLPARGGRAIVGCRRASTFREIFEGAAMEIDLSFEPSVANAPAGFVAAVENAAQFYSSLFTNPVAVAIDIGYGEIGPQTGLQPGGTPLASGAIGESESFITSGYSYGDLRSALLASARSLDAQDLPAQTPGEFTSSTTVMTTADAAALGLGPSRVFGGFVGFGTTSDAPFNFSTTDRAVPGEIDFTGVALHEISEVMGRFSALDMAGAYAPLDLFRYAAPGVRQATEDGPSYFSLDNGATVGATFNNVTTPGDDPSGDLGDWAPSVGPDAFLADTPLGTANNFTPRDLTVMNAIGWQSGDASIAPDGTLTHPTTAMAAPDAADATARSAALLAQAVAAFPLGTPQAELSVYRAPQTQPEVALGIPSPSSYGA